MLDLPELAKLWEEEINREDINQRVILLTVLSALNDATSKLGVSVAYQQVDGRYNHWSKYLVGSVDINGYKVIFDINPCMKNSSIRYTQRKTQLTDNAYVRKATKTFNVDATPQSIEEWFTASILFAKRIVATRT